MQSVFYVFLGCLGEFQAVFPVLVGAFLLIIEIDGLIRRCLEQTNKKK